MHACFSECAVTHSFESWRVNYLYSRYYVKGMEKPLIRVSEENKKRLASFGDASATMNDCLGRVLDLAEAMRAGGA